MRRHGKTNTSLVLSLALVLTCVGFAFADDETPATKNDSITINNAKPGESYSIYKLFDLTVNDENDPTSFSYKVNSDWTAFFAGDGAKYITVNDAGYVTEIKDDNGAVATNSRDLATAAAKYASKPAALNTIKVDADKDTAVFTGLADGYYLITSTLGSFSMADTTPAKTAVTINEKNDDNTETKEVQEDSTEEYGAKNDAQVGDTVNFKITANIAARSINVKIHDTMDAGLTFTIGSIKIYTKADLSEELAAAQYEVLSTPDSGDTFTIAIKDTFAADATATQALYITYSAVLNENAIKKDTDGVAIVDENNKTTLSWGDGTSTEQKTTTTTTHKFNVFKHATDSTTNLADAVFEVKKNGTVLNLIKLDDNNYRIAKTGETGTVATFTTVAEGDIVIWGVDSDSDYTLHETQAPNGYNLLKDEVEVTVNADNSTRADVENKSGTELPSTGGIGTTLFYLIGGLLVVGAAVVLVARRKAD